VNSTDLVCSVDIATLPIQIDAPFLWKRDPSATV
jgi:hypothetical protein